MKSIILFKNYLHLFIFLVDLIFQLCNFNKLGSLSQQLSQKGINVSIYNPQTINQIKQNSLYHQSAEKPRVKTNGSLHSSNNQSLALETQQGQAFNQALAFSANLSSGKKNNSQTNLSNLKTANLISQQQNVYTGIGKGNSSAQKQLSQQQQFEIPKDIQSLLQKKMLSQQHRRAESTKLAYMNQNLNSFSTNVSSQKKGDNNFVFPETTDDSNLQLQTTTSQISSGGPSITVSQSMTGLKSSKNKTEMHQQYYSNHTKMEDNIQNDIQLIVSPQVSSRSGQNQNSPFLCAQQILSNNNNNHFSSPLQLTPNRDPNDGGRFFLNLAKTAAKTQSNEIPQHFQKSSSVIQNEQANFQELTNKQEKRISDHKSQNNSPINNFFFGDGIVPLSAQIQKNQSMNSTQLQQIQTSQFNSPYKQSIKPTKVKICEPNNVIHYEKMQPIKNQNSYLQLQTEPSGHSYSKSVNLMSSRSELSDTETNTNQQLQIVKQPYPSKPNLERSQQQFITTSPPKLPQQIDNINKSNQNNQHELALVPPSQEEAKQQFQKILSTLQIQDQQNLLQELTNLYSQIFHLEDQKPQNQKKQEQQVQIQTQSINKQYQTSNGNDSTSTSSLDDLQGSSVKNKKTQEEKEREEFLKQEERVSLEQKVLLVNYVDINQDELFKLVREYYQTQTNQQKKYLSIRQEKISLQELLSIQKFIQEKLLERIDQEKKARLKTEEQTSMMLLNQEKTIKVMETKWQQQYESMRNGSTASGNSNNFKQPSPQDISCTLMDSN
ncbi:hypothetical protein TTHERM_01213940 (macronuclear) [Tetrahymena thermophila SB210]|uniref:Uncharacterized protein n=1 Tax=Tetrahymena thermophila (strain SB210) TaxID=312017 RepID=Q24G71_TETTS|nr:hypothetical protein TTHERM_01213940 [Tetrahymena thermophila SB210]EAS06782.2 hypothetical protein TTHERM_01213940 [Tetrahymena thermophila SB210]|eukprot:XP_001027024.2 hypothetical protein TTHERM_01213940 [Tetrahymena thermophila SB210]